MITDVIGLHVFTPYGGGLIIGFGGPGGPLFC